MVGIIRIMPEASIAATCVRVTDEISNPNDNETKINSKDTTTNQNRLPTTGTSSTNTESNRIVTKLTNDNTK